MGQLILVRHGQASWGAADYDVLSETGRAQARRLGRALAHLSPAAVVHGTMTRQRDTAAITADTAGWSVPVREDPGWDELDHMALLSRLAPPTDGELDPARFQRWFEAATDRWLGGSHDEEYDEPWPAFEERVLDCLRAEATSGTVVVFTSGGPVAAVTAALTEGGRAAYRRLAPVIVNASVTRVISGSRGLTLLTFNEHSHLDADLLTYR